MTTTPSTVNFTIAVPSTEVTVVTESLCKAGGYEVTGDATTDAANATRTVINWIVATVANVQASNTAPPPAPAPVTGITPA